MELELGLKITKTRDDITSISEFQLAKDRTGPVFQSRETNTMFILTAHLKGYKRNNIDIKISEDGSEISISGEKPIQEMLKMGWVMIKKEVEITGFRKVFKIPDGVILDRIKATYDEEESVLKIVMPKLVKRICGARIEEVKEDETDRGRLELEKREVDNIPESIGETSQEGFKESKVQEETEDGEILMEKKEGEVHEKMLDDADWDIIGEKVKKEIEESEFGTDDRDGESVREIVGKEGFETRMTSEREQAVGEHIPQKIGDTSQEVPKESVIQQMGQAESAIEKMEMEDSARMVVKDDEFTEEDRYREAKQKEFEELKFEAEDRDKDTVEEEIGTEGFGATKTLELDQNVVDHIPSKVDGISQEESKESGIQQMEKIENVAGKKKGEEYEGVLVEANKVIQKNIFGEAIQKDTEKPKIETKDGDQGFVGEEAGEEGFEAVKTAREEFPKQLSKALLEEREGLNVSKMEESKEEKEAMMKRKGKEIGCFVEKEEGEEPKRMHVEANRLVEKDKTKETKQKEIEEPKKETKESNQQYRLLGEMLADASKGFKVAKKEEPKEVIKEAMDETESFMQKVEDKEPQKTIEGTNQAIEKSRTRVAFQKEIEESDIERKAREGPYVPDNIVQGAFEASGTVQEKLPKQVGETMAQKENDKIKEVIKDAMDETESFVQVEEKEPQKTIEETNRAIEKSTTRVTFQKEIEESDIERRARGGPYVPDNVVQGVFEVLGTVQEKLPKQVGETMAREESDKIEDAIVQLHEEGSKRMHVEANEVFEKDTTGDRIEKEIKEPKFRPTFSDQQSGQENGDYGGSDEENSRKEFPKEVADSLFERAKRLNISEMEETEEVKEEGAEIEQSVKKVKGEKYEKKQVEADGSFRKDITRVRTWKETDEPKIQTKEKDKKCMQEELSQGRLEESKAAKEELPMKRVDSQADRRKEPKDTKIKEVKEVKEEVVKRKSEETKISADVESATKEKLQESESERMYKAKQITKTLQEVPEAKHPKALELGIPKKELQSTKGPTTHPKVVSMGSKEVEQGSAKDETQKKELLPPKIQSKETHELESESANHDILKPKKAKEAGEGEQFDYNIESTKAVAAVENQVAKPLSTPVEEKGKLYEGFKGKYETSPELQKEYPTSDFQNLIETKMNQESEERENLQPEIPLEDHLKNGEQVTRQDEIHKGQKFEEKIQEKTEEPNKKVADRDQQIVQRGAGKEVETVETMGKEMPKEEYVADGGQIAGRVDTQRELESTLDREKFITTQNAIDEKPITEQEIKKGDIEKVVKVTWAAGSVETTKEKEHPKKSKEVVESEAETPEAISSYPRVTSMGFEEAGPKSEIEELHQKDFPTLTKEMKIKEPLELEKPIMQRKFPKTKEHVLEPREREQYGYGTEDIKAPKVAAYEGSEQSKVQGPTLTQQSIDEEKRKSENVVEAKHEASKEAPKRKTKTDFQESKEWMASLENEEMENLQPQIPADQCLEENQNFGGQETLGGYEFQEITREETEGPKIVSEDRGQQYVQEDNDKKEYESTNGVEEELLKRKHRAETVLDKSEGPKVAKREETKEASKHLLGRETRKTTQAAEDKKLKMKEITPDFEKANGSKQVAERMHETGEREHHIESAEVTPKMGVEPPTKIAVHPKSASKEFSEVQLSSGIEKSRTEEISPLLGEIQRKDPHELSSPSLEKEILKIEGIQQEKEVKRPIHALQAATSEREEELAQATATHSKAKDNVEPKCETDKPQTKQLPSPSIAAVLSKEPYESEKFSVKKDDSMAESLPQAREGKELIHSLEGTKESKVAADEVARPSKFSITSTTQQDEVEEKDKRDVSHEVGIQESQESKKKDSKIDVQESTKSKPDQEVEQMEAPQPEIPADQQCIKKDQEKGHGRYEIEEEKANEQGDEAHKDDSQELEEQKKCKVEASGGKKDDTKRSKKLWVPLVIAGSAFIVSLIVIFVRKRRARKSTK